MNLENYNYWNDSRVISWMTTSYWKVVRVGHSSCLVEFEESFFEELIDNGVYSSDDSCRQEFPGEWQICNMCRGSGKVVNPSIDSGGIEDFYDWDFEEQEAYFSGCYDISCPECRGSGKNLVPTFPDNIASVLQEWDEEAEHFARICAAERAYGC